MSLSLYIINMDHSFLRNVKLWAEPWNLPVSMEFLCFHGILQNSVLACIRGQIRHILVRFRWPYCMYTWFHHKIHDLPSGSDGRNIKNIELSLSEILPVYLVDRLYLSAAVTCEKILHFWSGSWGCRKLIAIRGKFASMSCGICPRNLEKFAAENCGLTVCNWLYNY